eukprot:NODE_6671_length_827_cov_109.086648_g6435_i0.p1 GENE.NODE_6671_length_827_cov_109.086648_g6435_i0~~NODE_6671_length_827_cov_109.086648_g6435_i0.p1  ORF type:complete len:229 (-),score=24.10 NODE_6671_length_827_cov_109.086648_g6435_i0:7-693(-)
MDNTFSSARTSRLRTFSKSLGRMSLVQRSGRRGSRASRNSVVDLTPAVVPAAPPPAFRRHFTAETWSGFDLALEALNNSSSSITKEGIRGLLKEFNVNVPIDSMPEGLRAIGYDEGMAFSLTNMIDLATYFIWQRLATSVTKSESAFEALCEASASADTDTAGVSVAHLRDYIQQFGLDIDGLCPDLQGEESGTMSFKDFSQRFGLGVNTDVGYLEKLAVEKQTRTLR